MRTNYNTPKRNKYIRARLTESEKKDFDERLAVSNLSQTEYIRQAIFQSKVNIIVKNECSLDKCMSLFPNMEKLEATLTRSQNILIRVDSFP